MFKLWVKTFDDKNQIIENETFEFKQEFDVRYLNAYMQIVCSALKTETPVVLSYHVNTFNSFNRVKFTKADFIDKVDFNHLLVQLL